ncbi:TetR/AcrR family transcriptional regulator [Dictyobacter aurantiacus]|uniref:HTH tetR-type domain-containing protein n=1 Tax=Dictyobacter aurantiacus TaxID=1936993 RepID=A0A401ZAF9_9CHLR|nr:TetR/AcrR family transcriptional regulator [Dictyobacter aurantiacus]GCE03839.1 hypothetical protein KDAU_11680 [Dictyobacter aurantiacus]
MTENPNNETYTRILEASEKLFAERGYASVRLRDIAMAVGMRHASLYYYAPEGKQQLFIAVMERTFSRHRAGLEQAIRQAGDDLREQLFAVARWLLSQPPIDMARIQHADMVEIGEQQAQRLLQLAYNSLREPIRVALQQAEASGSIALAELDLAAMALVTLIQSVHAIPGSYTPATREKIGQQLVDMLLVGWLKR